jgi:hypothetical protein
MGLCSSQQNHEHHPIQIDMMTDEHFKALQIKFVKASSRGETLKQQLNAHEKDQAYKIKQLQHYMRRKQISSLVLGNITIDSVSVRVNSEPTTTSKTAVNNIIENKHSEPATITPPTTPKRGCGVPPQSPSFHRDAADEKLKQLQRLIDSHKEDRKIYTAVSTRVEAHKEASFKISKSSASPSHVSPKRKGLPFDVRLQQLHSKHSPKRRSLKHATLTTEGK